MNSPGEGLLGARAALERGDVAAARPVFEAAVRDAPCGDAYAGLAESMFLERDFTDCRVTFERAYSAYRDEGNSLGAFRMARMVGRFCGGYDGDWALYNGWMARARSILEEAGGDDTREHGRLELVRATSPATAAADREEHFRNALAIARRIRDRELEFEALAFLGAHFVSTDRVDQGMPLLDEALAAVIAGEVKEFSVIDEIFCGLLSACERAHDVARAEQWVRAATETASRRKAIVVAALCRAHYGGILTAAGRWAEAERELLTSSRLFAESVKFLGVNASVRLADLRVRQGRLEEAAQLLKGLDEHPDAVRPLAALQLARGEVALARDRIDRALSHPGAAALPAGVKGPLYALLVDVELADGRTDDARQAAAELARLAEEKPTDYLKAAAALAGGKVCLASGQGDARACLLEALSGFSRAEMPVELARARVELARAVAKERPEVAVAEATAALEAFEQLEARRDADAAAALLRELGAPARAGGANKGETLSKREAEVLDLLGHGLSNAEIADRMFISRKTVEHHVGRVLAKLGLRNRAEAAAYMTRR